MIDKFTYVYLLIILLASSSALPAEDFLLTVDRGCGSTYYAGESILITYRVQAEPTDTILVTIKEILPDSTMKVLLSSRPTEPGRMYTMRIFAQPIYGKETILMEYMIKSASKSSWHATECSFYIKEGNYGTGSLKIECTTTGFDIFIDDAFVAHSETESVTIDGIIGGGHTLTVKKEGCEDFTVPFTLAPGEIVTIKVNLDCLVKDKDSDLVPDERDRCHNPLCPVVDENGCPKDADGDGINDCDDLCPQEAGVAEGRGCPYGDADADGVPDSVDECDDPCTMVDEKGCPKDSDGDGIVDCEDDCPAEGGDERHFGCPERDSDLDGVSDDNDWCYNPGCDVVDEKGCPKDSDNDMISDCEDGCPNEAGNRETDGCPEAGINGAFFVFLGIVLAWKVIRR